MPIDVMHLRSYKNPEPQLKEMQLHCIELVGIPVGLLDAN